MHLGLGMSLVSGLLVGMSQASAYEILSTPEARNASAEATLQAPSRTQVESPPSERQSRAGNDSRLTIRIVGLLRTARPLLVVSGQLVNFEVRSLGMSKPVPSGEYTVKAEPITRGGKTIKPTKRAYVVSTVTGAESVLTIHYGRGGTAASIELPRMQRDKWSARFTIRAQNAPTRRGSLSRPVVIRNISPGWTTIQLEGSDGSLTAKPAAFRWMATPGVSLRLRSRIVSNSGTLAVSFVKAPALGVPRLVLTSAAGKQYRISKPKTSLPVGTYRVSAPAFSAGDTTYLPSPSVGIVAITAGDTSRLRLDFSTTISGPAITGPEVDILNVLGPPEKPSEVTLVSDVPVYAKVILPVSSKLPGGFVGVVTQVLPDGSVVAQRRPLLTVVPEIAVEYRVSEEELAEAFRSYARQHARDAECSVGALLALLQSTTPSSALAVLDADLTGIHRAGVSLALNAGLDEARLDLAGSCSLKLPPIEIALTTPVPLWLYYEVSIGASVTLSGSVDGGISPSASLEVGTVYDEDSGWQPIFRPTIDPGAQDLSGSWSYTVVLPEVTGELGLSPFPRVVSGAADLALSVRVTSALGITGPQITSVGERCWGQRFRSFSFDAVARASVLDGRLGGELTQSLYSPDDEKIGEPFWCFPITDEPVEMVEGNCTRVAQFELITFTGAVVPCSQEHTGQTIMVTDWPMELEPPWVLEGLSASGPERNRYVDLVAPFTEECFEAAAELLGVYEDYWARQGIFAVNVIAPNRSDWKQGMRWLACDLVAGEILSPGAAKTPVPIPGPSQLPGFVRSPGFDRYKQCMYKVTSTSIESISCSSLLAEFVLLAAFQSPFDYTSSFMWQRAKNDAQSRCDQIARTYFGYDGKVTLGWSWKGFLPPSPKEFEDVTFACNSEYSP